MSKAAKKGELTRPVRQTVTFTVEEGKRIVAACGLVSFAVWARTTMRAHAACDRAVERAQQLALLAWAAVEALEDPETDTSDL